MSSSSSIPQTGSTGTAIPLLNSIYTFSIQHSSFKKTLQRNSKDTKQPSLILQFQEFVLEEHHNQRQVLQQHKEYLH